MKLKTSEPFWLVKNGIIESYPSLRENIKTEILIVGGGITGSLIAHQCLNDGYDTVLIDRRELCNGSTSATTSMLQYEIDVPLYELKKKIGKKGAERSYWACFEAIDTIENISKEIKSKAGFIKKNSLYFAAFKKDIPWLYQEFEARKAAKFPVRWLDSEQIEKEYNLNNTFGGILSAQGGAVDAFRLSHEIIKFNHTKGLKVYDKTNITKTEYLKSGVKITTEYGDTITAKKMIYCTGFESTEIIKENFVKLLSTYAMVTERTEKNKLLKDMLVWNTSDPYLYIRTTDDHRILIGGEDEDFVNATKRDSIVEEKSKKLMNKLQKHLPENEFRTDFSWAGTFGETKDGLPYIGTHQKFPNTYFVLGFGGNGITFSVVGMDMVSQFLKNKEHELSSYFRFGR